MNSKVYTGTTSFDAHIEQLGINNWIPHAQRKANKDVSASIKPSKQSLQVRKLKQELGL